MKTLIRMSLPTCASSVNLRQLCFDVLDVAESGLQGSTDVDLLRLAASPIKRSGFLQTRPRDAGGGPAISRNARYSAKAMVLGESKSVGKIAVAPQASFALSSAEK